MGSQWEDIWVNYVHALRMNYMGLLELSMATSILMHPKHVNRKRENNVSDMQRRLVNMHHLHSLLYLARDNVHVRVMCGRDYVVYYLLMFCRTTFRQCKGRLTVHACAAVIRSPFRSLKLGSNHIYLVSECNQAPEVESSRR